MGENFVLIVDYESGESAFLTNTPNLQVALNEYVSSMRERWGDLLSKNCGLPDIKKARIVRIWK